MLDEAKRRTNPSPLYADASLGATLRTLVRDRRPSYTLTPTLAPTPAQPWP